MIRSSTRADSSPSTSRALTKPPSGLRAGPALRPRLHKQVRPRRRHALASPVGGIHRTHDARLSLFVLRQLPTLPRPHPKPARRRPPRAGPRRNPASVCRKRPVRPVFRPEGEFLAAKPSSLPTLSTANRDCPANPFPPLNHSIGDTVGYQIRPGGHDVTAND